MEEVDADEEEHAGLSGLGVFGAVLTCEEEEETQSEEAQGDAHFVDDGESVFGVIDFEPHGGEDGGQEDDEDGVDGLEP